MTGHTGAMTIVEFLQARIAEDEATARVESDWAEDDGLVLAKIGEGSDMCRVHTIHPDRILAECKAKRAIINYHQYDHDNGLGYGTHICQDSLVRDDECDVLCALASVYADHDDYDPAWE